ncbi:pentapeptide repeat-containing protein [Gordonia cholesterolivorans]
MAEIEAARQGHRDADLRGADLWDADFRGADFRGADFRGADFRGADFRGADLRGADLRGADLRGREPPGRGPHPVCDWPPVWTCNPHTHRERMGAACRLLDGHHRRPPRTDRTG